MHIFSTMQRLNNNISTSTTHHYLNAFWKPALLMAYWRGVKNIDALLDNDVELGEKK